MPIKIDMEGAGSGNDYEAFAAGDYHANIKEIKLSQKAGPSGYHYLEWIFNQIEGQNENRMLWFIASLSPNALWRLKAVLERLGVDVPEGEFEFDETALIGTKVLLKVGTQPGYRDPSKTENTVEDVLAPSESAAMGWG